ncbi:MAG: hypothetical protein J7J51_05305 [Candidatus Omnitrophica bacterium]|nr:hypothetical protein [Candidatus Omnitrophota bacterium]
MAELERFMEALKSVVIEYYSDEKPVISQYIEVKKGLVEAKFIELGGNHNRFRVAKSQALLRYKKFIDEDKYHIYIHKDLFDAWIRKLQQAKSKEEEEVDRFLNRITDNGE